MPANMTLNVDLLNASGRVFDWQPDPASYFATPAMDVARQQLQDRLVRRDGAVALVGPASAGKTLLLQTVLAGQPSPWSHVAQLAYTSMSASEMLQSVAYAFGMQRDMARDAPSLIRWIEGRLAGWAVAGESALLVVDEAHHLPMGALRPLLAFAAAPTGGTPQMSLVLAGHPSLGELLLRAAPGAASDLAPPTVATVQVIGVPAFQPEESAAYIEDRLRKLAAFGAPAFSREVIADIHRRAEGLPGRVNALCQQLIHDAALAESDAMPPPSAALEPAREAATPRGNALLVTAEPASTATATAAEPGPMKAPPPVRTRRRPGLVALAFMSLVAISAAALVVYLAPWAAGPLAKPMVATAAPPGAPPSSPSSPSSPSPISLTSPITSITPAATAASAPALALGTTPMPEASEPPPAASTAAASGAPATVATPAAPDAPSVGPLPDALPVARPSPNAGLGAARPVPAATEARRPRPAGAGIASARTADAASAGTGAGTATGTHAPVTARPQSTASATLAGCARLLSQLSLGEPLSSRQQHTLNTACR